MSAIYEWRSSKIIICCRRQIYRLQKLIFVTFTRISWRHIFGKLLYAYTRLKLQLKSYIMMLDVGDNLWLENFSYSYHLETSFSVEQGGTYNISRPNHHEELTFLWIWRSFGGKYLRNCRFTSLQYFYNVFLNLFVSLGIDP